jgi:hypothetical protein
LLGSATPADASHDGCRIVRAAPGGLRRALSFFRLPDCRTASAAALNGAGTSGRAHNPFLYDGPQKDGWHARTARNEAARLRNLGRGGGWVDRARVSEVRGGCRRVRRTGVPHVRGRCARVDGERLGSGIRAGAEDQARGQQKPENWGSEGRRNGCHVGRGPGPGSISIYHRQLFSGGLGHGHSMAISAVWPSYPRSAHSTVPAAPLAPEARRNRYC